jgi:hypothetical protein
MTDQDSGQFLGAAYVHGADHDEASFAAVCLLPQPLRGRRCGFPGYRRTAVETLAWPVIPGTLIPSIGRLLATEERQDGRYLL